MLQLHCLVYAATSGCLTLVSGGGGLEAGLGAGLGWAASLHWRHLGGAASVLLAAWAGAARTRQVTSSCAD